MNRDLLIQKMGQESFLSYCFAMEPKFESPDHLKLIARTLEKVEKGEIKRLMITMPPRHGKSFTTTELFPSWFMGRNPEKNIILACYGQNLADDFGRKAKGRISSPQYQEIFPDVSLAADSKAASRFSTNQGGTFYAVGSGGALTGRGGNILLIDDLIKNAEEARSQTLQAKQIDWYQTTLLTRLMPGGAIILVMTRWTDKDIASWILENDKESDWTVLSLPAISDSGEALWPERYPIEELMKIKSQMLTKNFNALYQQKPSPEEGNIIKREWIKYYEILPEKLENIVISVDPTFSNNPNCDYCAISVLARSRNNQNIYLLDFVRRRMDYIESYRAIKELAVKYRKATVLIENSGNGYGLITNLKREIPNVIGINAKDSKISRISHMAPTIESGQLFLPSPKINSSISDCVEELVTFPDGKNDDFSDSLAQGVARIQGTNLERVYNQLIDRYDDHGNEIGRTASKDIRHQFWPEHDWELEDFESYEEV